MFIPCFEMSDIGNSNYHFCATIETAENFFFNSIFNINRPKTNQNIPKTNNKLNGHKKLKKNLKLSRMLGFTTALTIR